MTNDRAEPIGTASTAGWTSRRSSVMFWACTGIGVAVLIVAWLWFGLSFLEEMTDQCKALVAGETMAGIGATLGLIPLLVAHLAGFAVLAGIAVPGRRSARSGYLHAAIAVGAASLIGIVVAEILFGGTLFTMGAGAAGCAPG